MKKVLWIKKEKYCLGYKKRKEEKYIQPAIENGKKREPLLWEAPRKMNNGMVHWFQLQGMFIGEQSGHPVYYGILLDTSEKKRLEIEQKIHLIVYQEA